MNIEKNNLIIIILLGLICLVVAIIGFGMLNNNNKELSNNIKYNCILSFESNGNYKEKVEDMYEFEIDTKTNKIINNVRYIKATYPDETIYNMVYSSINDDTRQIGNKKDYDYVFDKENLNITKKFKKIMYEEKINYDESDWLDNYLENLNKTYACTKIN